MPPTKALKVLKTGLVLESLSDLYNDYGGNCEQMTWSWDKPAECQWHCSHITHLSLLSVTCNKPFNKY